jgi:hypothetical protein
MILGIARRRSSIWTYWYHVGRLCVSTNLGLQLLELRKCGHALRFIPMSCGVWSAHIHRKTPNEQQHSLPSSSKNVRENNNGAVVKLGL